MLFKIKLTGMKTSRLVAEDPCSERSEVTRVEGGQRKESVKSMIKIYKNLLLEIESRKILFMIKLSLHF